MAPQELTFKQSFLNPGFVPKELLARPLPFSIIPPVPSAQLGFGSLHWEGYHCRRCGRLSCRVNWNGWECFNCHVGFNYLVDVLISEFINNLPFHKYDKIENTSSTKNDYR
jgi:hypothetical protein